MSRSGRGAALLAALGLAGGGALAAEGEIRPGAYCPLPKSPGERPACLDPAQAEYGGFFRGLDAGALDEAETDRLERDVVESAGSAQSYLALSSLSYGYYRLARQAAASEARDPRVVARLERWNGLLARAYASEPEDAAYRAAVREAALDLRARAPIALRCIDADGVETDCHSTEVVLRGIQQASDEAGIGAALERLFRRVFGSSEP